jgi:hypothetical protein
MNKQSLDTKLKKRIQRSFYFAVTLSVLLFILTGCAPTVKSVERTSDQNRLAKIAVEAKDGYVREAAVNKLTDQALLAKIAVEDKKGAIRKVAVNKLTDKALLEKIAVEDKEWFVREAAKARIDQLGD